MAKSSGRPHSTPSAGRNNATSPTRSASAPSAVAAAATNNDHHRRCPARVPARPGHPYPGSTCGHVRRQDQASLWRARARMTGSQNQPIGSLLPASQPASPRPLCRARSNARKNRFAGYRRSSGGATLPALIVPRKRSERWVGSTAKIDSLAVIGPRSVSTRGA
jgi:hypothetical protein